MLASRTLAGCRVAVGVLLYWSSNDLFGVEPLVHFVCDSCLRCFPNPWIGEATRSVVSLTLEYGLYDSAFTPDKVSNMIHLEHASIQPSSEGLPILRFLLIRRQGCSSCSVPVIPLGSLACLSTHLLEFIFIQCLWDGICAVVFLERPHLVH